MEEREPYHLTAIKNLIVNYSDEHFRFAIQQCRDVLAKVLAEDNRSNQQKARVYILRYLDRQLQRAAQWVQLEADLMALVLRNQTELRFWASYISRGEAEATTFLEEAAIDARELHDKMQAALPGEVADIPEPVTGKRISVTRRDEKEELLFRLCSKLIHPSSLTLTRPELVLLEPKYREYLSIEVVRHGWGILTMLHDIQWEE